MLRFKTARHSFFCLLAILACHTTPAAVITGAITNWQEAGPNQIIGDGVNSVTLWWSINTFDRGWFYGSNSTGDSDVALASGVDDISDIVDASVYSFESGFLGPLCDAACASNGVGDFVVWRNINTGHYGVLRIDDIVVVDIDLPIAYMNATWWFQTDGTGNFAPVPLPAGIPLLLSSVFTLGLLRQRRNGARESS